MDNAVDLSGLISSILKNPEVSDMISSMASKSNEKEAEETVSPASDQPLQIPPEILAKLPQMMSALSGISGIMPAPNNNGQKEVSPEKKEEAKRAALLRALRPYLSERRRTVIDGMLGMEGIAKVIGTLKDT